MGFVCVWMCVRGREQSELNQQMQAAATNRMRGRSVWRDRRRERQQRRGLIALHHGLGNGGFVQWWAMGGGRCVCMCVCVSLRLCASPSLYILPLQRFRGMIKYCVLHAERCRHGVCTCGCEPVCVCVCAWCICAFVHLSRT